MAAPTPTARGTPTGIPLKNGHPNKITISGLTTISFWEKEVQPPGVDMGDAIDQTTFHNTTWRTKAPRSLKDLTPVSGTAAYDPAVFDSIVSAVGSESTITNTYSDGSTLAFYGFLQKWEPQKVKDGDQPVADFTIVPTNWDPTNKVEAAPVLTSVSGT